MFVIHTSHEPGRGNAGGVRPDYLVCDYLGSCPHGGLPYGHQARNTVRSASIFPIGIWGNDSEDTVGEFEKSGGFGLKLALEA